MKVVRPGKLSVIGNGVVIDPAALMHEIAERGVAAHNIYKDAPDAKEALEDANCKLGKITKKKVKKPKPGIVLSQTPAAGQQLPAGTAVNVSVSQKKKKKKK